MVFIYITDKKLPQKTLKKRNGYVLQYDDAVIDLVDNASIGYSIREFINKLKGL